MTADQDSTGKTDSGSKTVQEHRRLVRTQLANSAHDIDPREANLLIRLALGCTEVEVLTRGSELMPKAAVKRVEELVAQRCLGRPFAYLEHEKEFFGRRFYVDERVLIPRPETEHLIEATLALRPSPRRLIDLGTGSGCIAITLALELPSSHVLATDLSIAALAVARRNATSHGLSPAGARCSASPGRFRLVASDLVSSLDVANFDTVVSNPPYVSPDADIAATVRDFEPAVALFANEAGFAFYQRLVGPKTPLASKQRLVLELGADQLDAVIKMADSRFRLLSIVNDLSGWQRVVVLERA